jgi:hypothetical protein
MRRQRHGTTWTWVRRAQVPIGVAGVALGIYEAATGELALGILVAGIACTAALLAISRLRGPRP